MPTQEYSFLAADYKEHMAFRRFTGRLLKTTLLEAAYAVTHTGGGATKDERELRRNAREALLFVEGTGFDLMIKHYNLSYDPGKIRAIFNSLFHIQE